MTLTASPARRPSAVAAARTVDITKVYGSGGTAVRALDGVTVELPAGRLTAVTGPSGSGRSTFMYCVAGLDSVTSDHVLWYARRGRHLLLSRRALGPATTQGVT